MKEKVPPGRPKKILLAAALAGGALTLVFAWALVFFTLSRDRGMFPGGASPVSAAFRGALADYDDAALRESPEARSRRLDALTRRARGQDERLSVLKRRRALAREDAGFLAAYRDAAVAASREFPHAESLAAVAAEALLAVENGIGGAIPAPGRGDALVLNEFAAALSQSRFALPALALRIAAGGFDEPGAAPAVSGAAGGLGAETLLAAGRDFFTGELQEALRVDELLLGILRGGSPETAVKINALLRDAPGVEAHLALGAEYFYDSGGFLQAADLFARLGGADNSSREADALALAGEIPAARNIWTALGAGEGSLEIRSRSLYNLAATAGTPGEEEAWLEKLFLSLGGLPGGGGETGDPGERIYGAIRYTRLLETNRAIAILEEIAGGNPLLDLELFRRRAEAWTPDRAAAEAWLLLGRHPGSEDLYRWGAYYFDLHKRYAETAQVLKIAAGYPLEGAWPDFHRALALIREGKTGAGERLFRALREGGDGDWRLAANLARVQEGRRSVTRALELYEAAAAAVPAAAGPDAAVLQLRISRCLEAQGRYAECRAALEKAQALDPGNLSARYELRRLDASGR